MLRREKKGGYIFDVLYVGIFYYIMLVIKVEGISEGICVDCSRDYCYKEEYFPFHNLKPSPLPLHFAICLLVIFFELFRLDLLPPPLVIRIPFNGSLHG